MNKSKILLSSMASLIIFSSQAYAENEELQAVDVWETEIISSSLNLGKDSIETKQADHLSDLLRELPGVDVGGTHSINNRINIRGLQDDNLEITLDGAKVQNANMFHHIGNLLINPDILKKANIQVGTNSVVNGSLGGSVAFETKDGKDMLEKGENLGARISSTYDSNDSISGSITAYGKFLENADFLIYHRYLDKNDWKDGNGTKTFGTEGKINNTLVKFGFDINDTQRISLSYDRLKDKGDYSPRPNFGREFNLARTGTYTYPTEYTRDTFTLKHELNLGEDLLLNTTVYSNENELERYEYAGGVGVRPGYTEGNLDGKVKTAGFNTKAQSNIQIGSILNTFTYGTLYDKQTSKVKWNGEKYGEDESAKTFALYVEDALDFDNGFILTPGIRYNNYKYNGAYGNIHDDKFTYGLAAQYSITDDLTLLASVTSLYKGVEMVDVLDSTRTNSATVNNLKAETGLNKEIGFRYIKDSVLGADTIGLSFKYFHTDIDDYIDTYTNGSSQTVRFNNGKLKIKGFETSFKYIKNDFSGLLTYSHSSSNFENTGEPLVEQPGDSISLGLNYKINPRIDFSWNSLFVLKETDVPSGVYKEKASYNVHDLALKWNPKKVKGLTVIAGIDNIFDKAYYSHISDNRYYSGFGYTTDYEPGRNFKLTLSYKF